MAAVILQLPDALEQKLQTRAKSQGRDAASVALELVEQGLHDDAPTRLARDLTPEQRLRNFQEYLQDRPRIEVELDDSRESIYEGRGE